MQFNDLIRERRSIRAFGSRDVDKQILDGILEQALQSPSWNNTQPYQIAIARGAVVKQLRSQLTHRFHVANAIQRAPHWKKAILASKAYLDKTLPDFDFKPPLKYPGELQKRRAATGFGLYKALGIERNDYAARDKQMARNYSFFDAPVVIFVFTHKALGSYGALDAGIFMQTLMLAATDSGLGSCAQGGLGMWRKPLEQFFEVPEDYKLLCGMSLGYVKQDPVNEYRPGRIDLESITLQETAYGNNENTDEAYATH